MGKDTNSAIQQRIDEYSVKYLDEHDAVLKNTGSNVIQVPANINQAQELINYTNHLAKAASYIHLLEDSFLGERYESYPDDSNQVKIQEWFISAGLHVDEREDHTFLEFLQVLKSQNAAGPFKSEVDEHGRVSFSKPHMFRLRNILYNNPSLDQMSYANSTPRELWDKWVKKYNDHVNKTMSAKKDNEDAVINGEMLATHYEKVFPSFYAFADAVKLLRSWSIDLNSSREMGTKFLFPSGKHCVFTEVNKSNNAKSNFFAGQGEILYSILQRGFNKRASSKDETSDFDLGEELYSKFFEQADAIDQFAENLQATEESSSGSFTKTEFMPYKHLKIFESFYEDMSNLMQCSLSKQDLFIALGTICLLNLNVYVLEQECKMCQGYERYLIESVQSKRSAINKDDPRYLEYEQLDTPEKIEAYIEEQFNSSMMMCLDGKDQKLKKQVKERLGENALLYSKSSEAYLLHRLERFVDFTAPFLRDKDELDSEDIELLKKIICCCIGISPDDDVDSNNKEFLEQVMDNLERAKKYKNVRDVVKFAANLRDKHMNSLHYKYSKRIGLVSGSQARYAYYDLSDNLLKTLVRATLGKEPYMMLKSFLERLKEKYNIVISKDHLDDERIDKDKLEGNVDLLKQRLQGLNMLITLSDSCEYVKKP
ncbi:hypothetical protein [uncultured Anaerobiospirillum sp.]|uniref:hypothetical protein n=1 Tax=uncultured Anaerobiospirillum sp. TaxID=265728 RepID=UPI002805B4AA|nr:hypothetical protein [uncultured Anaerobiospirillum sp.]